MGTKEKIAVWGASGHAKVVSDVLRQNGFEIAGFIDDQGAANDERQFCGAKVFPDAEGFLGAGVKKIFVAIGNNTVREEKSRLARAKGFELVSAVHPSAVLASDVELGTGTIVMAGAVINPGTIVGDHAIINTQAGVDHDCTIGDGVHLSPGVRMAGHVKVGRLTWVGIGATIIDHITIGEQSVVAAGAVVIKDVPARVLVAGVPARVIKHLNPN
jgi:acetyltransferase EpsM